jgi:hypothetical protein
VTRRVTHFRQCLFGISPAIGTGVKNKYHVLLVLFALLAGLERAAAWSVTLGWNASPSADAAGYNIYYGTTSGSYTNKITVGNVTSATISNLTAGVTYYFAATTCDTNANESAFSNEASFILSGVLTMSQGANAGAPALIQFPVEPGHWYEVQATTDLQSWTTIKQTDVATANIWVQFTDPNAGDFKSRFYRLVLH